MECTDKDVLSAFARKKFVRCSNDDFKTIKMVAEKTNNSQGKPLLKSN